MLPAVLALRAPGAIAPRLPLPRSRGIRNGLSPSGLHPPDPGLVLGRLRDGLQVVGRHGGEIGAAALAGRRWVVSARANSGGLRRDERSGEVARAGFQNGNSHSDGARERKKRRTRVRESKNGNSSSHCEHEHSSSHCQHEHEHEHEHDDHAHDHEDQDETDHPHEHGCSHGHSHGNSDSANFNGLQKLVQKVAQVVGLAWVANRWRDNLKVCCASLALLLLGALAPHILPPSIGPVAQAALVLPALPLTGVPAGLDAAIDVAGGRVNIHVLMALAAFASVFMGNALEGGLLLAMFSLSHLAEDYFTERALGDVRALKESNPESALVLEPFDVDSPPPMSSLPYKLTPVKRVEIGSYFLVKAGETVPVDGEVWQGRAKVTVEHLTGEAQPVEKKVGESVPGGARSLDGAIIVKATKSWKDSTVARIMQLTEEAQRNRPTLQRWLDEFGEQYSQAVVAMSLAVALLGPLLFKWPFLSSPGVRGSVYRALGLMVAASPCALAVAPLAYSAAISSCANKGILLKGGEALDALAVCDVVAFDKTGTLTTGDLVCKAIEPLRGHCEEEKGSNAHACCSPSCEMEALAVAAAMERGATHPIARAVVEFSAGKMLPSILVENFHAIPGEGVVASVVQLEAREGSLSKALLGSLEYVASSSNSPYESKMIREAARSSVFGSELVQAALSINNKITLFHFEDKLRPQATKVIKILKKDAGLRVVMLTGDHAASAQRVADAVGIDEVYSRLKPEDKLHQVKTLARQKVKKRAGLIMVGDGINDAPALAAATVGIVLAKRASGTAIAVADVLLLQDAIDGVSFVIAKARQTTSIVEQSVALALSCIFMASLPSVMGFLPLWLTVLLHEGGTLLVCVNSARALNDPVWSWEWRDALSRFFKSIYSNITKLRSENAKSVMQQAPTSAN